MNKKLPYWVLALVIFVCAAPVIASADNSVAIVISDGTPEVELAARDAVGNRKLPVMNSKTVKAAMAFLPAGDLSAARLEELRNQLTANFLISIQVKATSNGNLAVKVTGVSASASTSQFGSTKRRDLAPTVEGLVDRVIGELLAKSGPEISTEHPTPATGPVTNPRVVGSAEPAPESTAPVSPNSSTTMHASIPDLVVPKTLKPIPLSDPTKAFKATNPYRDGTLKLPPAYVAVALAPALSMLVLPDFDADFLFVANASAGYRLSPMLGVAASVTTLFRDGNNFSMLGLGLNFLGDMSLTVGLAGSDDVTISDLILINMHANFAFMELSPTVSHGPSFSYVNTVVFADDPILSFALAVGWGITWGATLSKNHMYTQYRKKVWEHQREQLPPEQRN